MTETFDFFLPIKDGKLHIIDVHRVFRFDEPTDVLYGTTYICGTSFHVVMVKVHFDPDLKHQTGTNDPEAVLQDCYAADPNDDGSYLTVKIPYPGCEGDWVLVIHPYRD